MAQQWYPQGTRPRILINWQSFVAQGINAAWQGPFTDAVINAYTRWMNIAGVDLRFRFFDYTTQTTANPGELLIQMDAQFGGGAARLASTFGQYNSLTIIFHRRNATNGTPWNFVPYNAGPGEFDMQTILTHELGHCYGLDHSANTNDTMFQFYSYFQRYGPFEGDSTAVKALYSDFAQNRLRQLRSLDGAVSWSGVPNELTPFNNYQARTTLSPGAAEIRETGLYVLGWSHPNRVPTWLRTDGEKFLMRRWFFYGGERSVHGSSFASGDHGTLLWAAVNNDDNGTIQIRRSDNHGQDWFWAGTPPGARTAGTPGLAWTRVGNQSTWILVWANFDRTNQSDTGKIRASLSTDNGSTWSVPVTLNAYSKALSGVSVAASASNAIVVAFAFAGQQVAGMNNIHTLRCQVNAGQLQVISYIGTLERTRIQPALVYDVNRGNFIMAWREQNYNTTLATMRAAWGTLAWSTKVNLLGTASNVAPSLAAVSEYGEHVLWYAFEGP